MTRCWDVGQPERDRYGSTALGRVYTGLPAAFPSPVLREGLSLLRVPLLWPGVAGT